MLHHYIAKLVSQSACRFCTSVASSPVNSFSLRSHNCGELRLGDVGKRVKLYGWLAHKRLNTFLVLRDAYGKVQAFAPKKLTSQVQQLTPESAISIEGTVKDRGKDRNTDMATGDIEILVDRIELLNQANPVLPFFDYSSNEITRQTHRYLDLRSERKQCALRLRAKVISKMRRFLEDECGFLDVQTPTLAHFTPGGAAEFLVPANGEGQCYSLPQSPQIYKQLLMCGGIDRYYQVAICYRDESVTPFRQPEFTQLDLEMSFSSQQQIMELVEQTILSAWPPELGPKPRAPFTRMAYKEAMSKYGTDKPDIRSNKEQNSFEFLWVNRFPLFTRNPETGALESTHHPFTAPIPEHIPKLLAGEDLENIEAQHYDLVLNGVEIGGGSIRIHDAAMQRHVLEKLLRLDTTHLNHLFSALSYGAPPHGDPTASIRGVIAFPKGKRGQCLMTGSPSLPTQELLARYGLVRKEQPKREQRRAENVN